MSVCVVCLLLFCVLVSVFVCCQRLSIRNLRVLGLYCSIADQCLQLSKADTPLQMDRLRSLCAIVFCTCLQPLRVVSFQVSYQFQIVSYGSWASVGGRGASCDVGRVLAPTVRGCGADTRRRGVGCVVRPTPTATDRFRGHR